MHGHSSRRFRPDLEFGNSSRTELSPSPLRSSHAPLDRLVSLIALSDCIPTRLIADKVARLIQEESDRSVMVLDIATTRKSNSLMEWKKLQEGLNGSFHLSPHVQVLGQKVHRLTVGVSSSPLETGHVLSLMDYCKGFYDYVLLQLGNDLPVAFLLECLRHVDRSFLFIQASSRDLYLRDIVLRELRVSTRAEGLVLKTIVCREKGEDHQNDVLKKLGPSVHGFVHGCPSKEVVNRIHTWSDRSFHDDLRRLAREIGHCRIGLVLSSGGARGLSHIGVIQVLEEAGIDVDIVAGCSMGSYVGAVWAFGYDGLNMERLAREVEHRWGLIELLDPFLLPRRGFIKGERIKRRLRKSIGHVHFSELPRPLRVVATNHTTLERVVFSTGEVAEAVHASSAIPGAIVPVNINGSLYIDGGICDPLPVDVLREMGIERVIAVNTIPTPSYLKCGEELKREHDSMQGKRPNRFSKWLNTHLNYFAPGNILDTIFRSFHGAQIRVAEQSCKEADLVLRPLCWDGRWHDFKHPGKYIHIGRKEAEEHLGEIKSLANRKERWNDAAVKNSVLATA